MLDVTLPSKQSRNQDMLRNARKMPRIWLLDHFCKEKLRGVRTPLSKTWTFQLCKTCGAVARNLTLAA